MNSYQRYKTNEACYIKEGDVALKMMFLVYRERKGKIEKLIYSDDDLVRAAGVRVYQPKKDKTIIL